MQRQISGICTSRGRESHPTQTGAISFGSASIVNGSEQLLKSADNSFALILLGNAYLESGADLDHSNFESEFLPRFRQNPADSLRELDGAFAMVVLSGAGDCWLATDHFGTLPLHYSERDGRFAFGTSMSDVCSAETSFDTNSLLVYFGLGLTLSGSTYYQGVKRLDSATIVHWSPTQTINQQRYYRPRYVESGQRLEDSLESIRGELTAGLERRLRGAHLMAALTGGLDSRLTWSMMLSSGVDLPLAHTHGVRGAHDLKVAREIAEGLNLKHDTFELEDSLFRDIPRMWRDIATLGEGVVPIHYAFMLPVLEHQLALGASALLDSYGGTFYRRQRMKVAELRIDPTQDLVSQVLPYEYSPLLRSDLLRPDVRQDVMLAIEEAIRAYYESIAHIEGVGNKLDLYHLEQVNPMRDSMLTKLESTFRTTVHPLMNHRAIDIASTLPIKVRRRDLVHKYVIRKSFPALERFTLDNVGFPVSYRGSSVLRYGPMVLERVGKMLTRHGIAAGRHLMLRKPTFNPTQQIAPGLEYLTDVLTASNSNISPYVNQTALRDALERCAVGDYTAADALLQLMTLELWLGKG